MTIQQKKIDELQARFSRYTKRVSAMPIVRSEGKLTRLVGLTLEAVGCEAPIGSRCLVVGHTGESKEAEVIGFGENKLYLMCVGDTQGLAPGARIILTGQETEVPVSENLLGRILDGSGKPLDGKLPITATTTYPLLGRNINPLDRATITAPLDVGIQALNALLTVGVGQRIGLFAGSGVGKSVLLGMMTRFTAADVVVVGMIGERGREVKEFIEVNLGREGLARAVVIASPADYSPLMRLRGALWATTIAEYFRDQGANVLLLMDSLTRFAQAQREIGLAIGEPPATKGYPPSVFSRLPHLVERAGNVKVGGGSITAFYTVLVEGDDQQEPIADAARAILDGHVVLSRRLAERGHYPAIDIESSISRVMENVVTSTHAENALLLKRIYAKYRQNLDLITIGAYTSGADPELDLAIQMMPTITDFLCQRLNAHVPFSESLHQLETLCQRIRQALGTS